MGVAEDIHRVLQRIVIVEVLQTAGDGEDHLGAFAHVQRVNRAGVLDHVVAWSCDPVVPRKHQQIARNQRIRVLK